MAHNYAVEFFLEDDGSSPVARWITEELSAAERRTVTAALSELIAEMGKDICATDFGKNIGYSKHDNPSKRHQQAQIGVARKRLAHWQRRERQQEKARKRAPPKGR